MDELQSMGLTAEVEYIPIDTSKVPYTFSIKLDDRTYTLRCGTGDQCFG